MFACPSAAKFLTPQDEATLAGSLQGLPSHQVRGEALWGEAGRSRGVRCEGGGNGQRRVVQVLPSAVLCPCSQSPRH